MKDNNDFTARLAQDLAARGEQLAAQDLPAPFRGDLQAILDHLPQLDFRQLAGAKADEKIKKQDALVIAVRELIRIVEEAGSGLTADNGLPYAFNGKYWQVIGQEEMQGFLAAAATALGIDELTAEYFETQDKLYKQFLAAARLQDKRQDPDTILINFDNGTLEIRPDGSRRLREHRRADFLTYALPYPYDRTATCCPLFTAYLDKVLPDTSAQAVLAEFVGNCLAPQINLQKALVLYGQGSNGKSVFCRIVGALLGQVVTNFSMTSLTREKFTRAELDQMLLNICDEGPAQMDNEIFKALVTGDPIKVERKYEKPFTMTRYARIMFNCNLLPREVEQSEGYFRRFLIVPFTTKIEESERDPELAAKIIDRELPAILNWVLQGLDRVLLTRTYTECESASKALETYRKESNSVCQFIEEYGLQPGTMRKRDDRAYITRLYMAYQIFCRGNGYYPMGRGKFREQMQAQGYAYLQDSKGFYFDCVNHQAAYQM